ncbi:SMC-Scp complex subunit ScpB [Chitinophaga silvisoli]|uniref:SMC-Scp complex subunit ScpB n=1 Tax=Chitinophaga silvisoli TaxID=2291814 RepID=A0A3E1P339_9BACT|nr:SMC-Scp complex subunit ScpB [Chitinophaga silvisoli]RFM34577.1 SMC-Scp complex subunit ScpB [Chitinophaga silvisoli]
MEISQIIPHVESLIFAADRPLPVLDITDLLNNALAFLEDRVTVDQVETAIEAIREKYSTEFYAFEVRESGGGFQFLTKKEYYQTVAQLNGDKFLKRLSTAALETLAIVAYKQPISKGEIEHIRGVSTDYSITKLLEKELIVISGRSETLPGKPLLYSTSKAFMDYFGLNSPKDLPKLKEVFEDDVQPTLIAGLEGGNGEEDDAMILRVSENGELVEEEVLPVIEEEVSEEVSGQLELPLGQEKVEEEEETTGRPDAPTMEEEVEEGAGDVENAGDLEEIGDIEDAEDVEEPGEEEEENHPDNVIIEKLMIEDTAYVPDPREEEEGEKDDEVDGEELDEDDFDEEEDDEEEDDDEEEEEDDEEKDDEDFNEEEENDEEDDDYDDEEEDDEDFEDEDDEGDEDDEEEDNDDKTHSK